MTMITADAVHSIDEAPAPLSTAACVFRGFSDTSRLAILRQLTLGEQRVVDLTHRLGLAQSTVSQHLACLRECGLVEARPVGRATVYSLTHADALMDLWAAAERLLALTGNAVALCPNYGAAATSTLTNTDAARHPVGAR